MPISKCFPLMNKCPASDSALVAAKRAVYLPFADSLESNSSLVKSSSNETAGFLLSDAIIS